MVTVAFGVVEQPVRAATTGLSTLDTTAAPVTVYGPGTAATTMADGTRRLQYLPTFQRWDGVWKPESALNRSTGDWPYFANESSGSITVTRLGRSFTQAKISGAVYEYDPAGVKETVVFKLPPPDASISLSFTSTYSVSVAGTVVALVNASKASVWATASLHAWDSSTPAHTWARPVTSISYSNGVLQVALNRSMLSEAMYPLYIDPTWVLTANANNVWSGTLDHVTSDWGDHKLKIGLLADDFDDNTNDIWTIEFGSYFVISGGRAQISGGTEVLNTSASWSNVTFASTVNFESCGFLYLYFRNKDANNYYQLQIGGAAQTLQLSKFIAGVQTSISPAVSTTINSNTNYSAKVVAKGNSFAIWWNGAKMWNGTDPSPLGSPLTGSIGFGAAGRCFMYLDNVRAWDPSRTSGNYTSPIRDAGAGYVPTLISAFESADAYNSTDLWINASSDNHTWGGWHLVKSTVAPGVSVTYYVPDIDRKRYYQVRAVTRTGVDGTPAVQELDVTEATPPVITAMANTGYQPWTVYVGDMVNAVSGNLFLSSTDLSFRAKGFTLGLTRAYNSKLASSAGPFGYGTTHNFNAKLSFLPGGNVAFAGGDGASYTFYSMGGSAYSPPRGIHDNLLKNADGTYTLWMPDGSRMNFDSFGNLMSLVDRNGNHLTLTYTNGNPTQISDDSGLYLTLVYDASNRITSVTDPVNRKVSYTYNTTGVLTNVTDPVGFVTNYTYDSSNRLIQRMDPAGHVDKVMYDGSARVSQLWVGNWSYVKAKVWWSVREYSLAYAANITNVTNAEGSLTTLYFNRFGNPTAQIGPNVAWACPCSSNGNSSGYTWDGEFDRLTATDGRGRTVTYAYDWLGDVVAMTDPGGNRTVRTYSNVQNGTQFISLLTGVTTPRGFTTAYSYYANGNLYTIRHPDSNVSYQYYDAAGSLIKLKDFRGNSIQYGYDAHEFPINSTDAAGNVTLYQNDGIGRRWNTTSPGGNTTRDVYDKDNRVTSVTDANKNTTGYTYDNRGGLIYVTDANLRTTSYAINLTFGGIQKVTDAGGNSTSYVYNVTGQLIQVIDADQHVTSYVYDKFHREIKGTTPLGNVTIHVYDAAGNQISRTDANGNTTKYTYDRSNRQSTVRYPNGQTVTVTYDKDGNAYEQKGLELDEVDSYDSLERLVSSKQVFLTTTLTVWANYTYDANGNRLAEGGTAGGAGSYAWDKNNRLYSRSDSAGNRWTYAYDRDGRQAKVTDPDGEYTTYLYNADGWLLNETSRLSDGTILEFFTYTYDRVGNRLSMKEFRLYQADQDPTRSSTGIMATADTKPSGLSPTSQNVVVRFRVQGILWTTKQSPSNTITWYYVKNGIATSMGSLTCTSPCSFDITKTASIAFANNDTLYGKVTFSVIGKTTVGPLTIFYGAYEGLVSYVYDKQYRIAQITYANGTVEKFTYDAVGNRVTHTYASSTVTYAYDADNRLKTTSNGAVYTYDANGNTRTVAKAGLVTTYAYDYENRLTSVAQSFQSDYASSRCGTGVDCTADADPGGLAPSSQVVTLSLRAQGIAWSRNGLGNAIKWYYVLNGVATQMGTSYSACANCNFDVTRTASVSVKNGDLLYGEITFTENTNVGVSTTILRLTYAPSMLATTSYGYSADGMRTTVSATGSQSKHYAYDVAGGLPQPTGEFSSGSLQNQTLYDVGTDRPLERSVGSTGYYVHADGLGSVTSITNASQGLQSSYRYDAYGRPIQAAGFVQSPYEYTGREWDANDALLYDRARYYDPTTGRFLSPDPVGGGYAYAGDNPANFVDPTGLARTNGGAGSGGGGPGSEGFSLSRCSLGLALFLIGTIAGLVGVAIPGEVPPAYVVADLLVKLNSFGTDVLGVLNSLGTWSSNLMGVVLSVLQLLWDIGIQLVQEIVQSLISGFFELIAALLGISTDLFPPVLVAKFILWGVSTMIGIASLAEDNCIPGM